MLFPSLEVPLLAYLFIYTDNASCRCVSKEDADLIRAKGLAVVDCSWNRLDDVPFGEPLLGHLITRQYVHF